MIGHDAALDLAAIGLDFELPADERAALDAHLATCPACRRRAAGLRADARGIAMLSVRPLPPERADEITGAILGRSSVGHPFRLVLVAALLGLVALGAAVVGAGLLRHAREDLSVVPVPSVFASPAPAGSVAPTTTPEPSPVTLADEPIWVRLADQAAFDHAAMLAVASAADRVVAVGCASAALESPTEATCTAAGWVSLDGRTWQRAEVDSADHSRLEGVVSTPFGLVAWGRSQTTDRAPIWRSSDGTSWERSPSVLGRDVSAIVWSGSRLVAYGEGTDASQGSPASFWTSPDGLAWTPVEARSDCVPLAEGRSSSMLAAGGLILVPGAGSPDSAQLPHGDVATSSDGQCWSVSDPIGGSIVAAVDHGPGFVGVGSQDSQARAEGDPPPPLAAWTSTDGVAFRPATFSPSAPRGRLGLVVSTGARLTALGEALAGGYGYEPTSWTSIDGTTWTVARSVPDAMIDGLDIGDCTGGPCDLYRTRITGLAARGDSLVAVGLSHLPSGGYRAVVWVADARTAIPPVQLAVGTEATTLTADLRVRSQPRVADDSVKYQPLLAKGTFLHVLQGPVYDTGYWWYRIAPYVRQGGTTVEVKLSGGATDGWVAAAARDGTPWIGPVQDVDCGPAPCPSG